jgi:hypothetical protein
MSSEEVIEQFSAPSKGTWIAFLTCGVLLLVWISVELMFLNARLVGARPISGKEPGAVLACVDLNRYSSFDLVALAPLGTGADNA